MSTMLDRAVDTAEANRYVAMGFATRGDLLLRNGVVVRVTKTTRAKYYYVDEDGREWTCPHRGFEAAPVGAVFAGPEKSKNEISREKRVAEAGEYKVGDIVQMKSAKDRAKFPGTYLITKRTAPTRFKLVGVGTGRELTSPAGLIEMAMPGSQ